MAGADTDRALLDQLLDDSRLYTRSKDFKDLLDFAIQLRNFAPFNAMLLQIQKPGLRYAATAKDWEKKFGRWPEVGARPLLILWPFGPVALVYDVVDTEGARLPEDVASFPAQGEIDEMRMASFMLKIQDERIECHHIDAGDMKAGEIRVVRRMPCDEPSSDYAIYLNRNHDPTVKFVTLTHELGHLYLGHLDRDQKLRIPDRPRPDHNTREIEAESVAYIVCHRNGVEPKSQTYLSEFVDETTTTDQLDIYQIMRAAGQVESLLGLSKVPIEPASYARPSARNGRKPQTSQDRG